MKEFSKKMVFIPWIPFLFIVGLFAYLVLTNYEITEIHQYIFISLITATGGIAATTNVWYLKKSQAENTYKVKKSLYEDISRIDLEHLEKSLELRQKYGDIAEADSRFPQLREDAFDDLTEQVNSDLSEATEKINKEEI